MSMEKVMIRVVSEYGFFVTEQNPETIYEITGLERINGYR